VHVVPVGHSPSALQSREHLLIEQYPNSQSVLAEHALPVGTIPNGKQSPMRLVDTEPSDTHENPNAQPPSNRHVSMHESPAEPAVVVDALQSTAGTGGMSNAWKSMCCASLQMLMTFEELSHAYCVGVAPPGSGPKTSGGLLHNPSHVHGAKPAARCGQSAAVLHAMVHPGTSIV
jgi:hypothetical protein